MKKNEKPAATNTLTPAEQNAARMIEIEKKAAELAVKLNCYKVTPVVFNNPKTHLIEAVGYLREPTRDQKLAVMDLAGQGQAFSSATQIFDICIIKEESDPRIYSDLPENDMFYLGAVKAANEMIQMYINQFKKK